MSFRDLSLETLLTCHRSSVLSSNPEDWFWIIVWRKHIFEDTPKWHWHLRVTFIGEPAIDDGSPMREYMRLLLGSIISNNFIVLWWCQFSLLATILSSIRKHTSMLVRYCLFHSFMVDQLLPFSLSQLPTISSMDWRLKFPLQIYKTRQGNQEETKRFFVYNIADAKHSNKVDMSSLRANTEHVTFCSNTKN